MVYDMCKIDDSTTIQFKISSNGGRYRGKIEARIDKVEKFQIMCAAPTSDYFRPRQDHGACQSWDDKLYVFGGKTSEEGEEILLNDIMQYNQETQQWINHTPASGDSPQPRHSFSMFCYYNYLFVFGGKGENGKVFGDLWIYDIVRQDWHPIIDSDKMHQLAHDGLEGIIPSARYGSKGVLFQDFGSAILIGGMTKEGIACDIWSIDLDYIINLVERPDKYKKENIWQKRKVDKANKDLVCRYGHTTGLISKTSVFVFGGIDKDNNAIRQTFAYDFRSGDLTKLKETGTAMKTRIGHGLLSTGNGMMLLYGGDDPQGKGQFSDMWHIRVHLEDKDVHYSEAKYKGKHEHYILAWRKGFTMHWIRSVQHPVLIGGTFGNN